VLRLTYFLEGGKNMEQHKFMLGSGRSVEVQVQEKEDCIVTTQRFILANGVLTKQCTVTCSTGKSYSWTCSDNQSCAGDCSDPNNPKGHCE
jgi:hypothetical protein